MGTLATIGDAAASLAITHMLDGDAGGIRDAGVVVVVTVTTTNGLIHAVATRGNPHALPAAIGTTAVAAHGEIAKGTSAAILNPASGTTNPCGKTGVARRPGVCHG